MESNDEEKLQHFLFTNAMNGNWSNVVKKYSEDRRAHKLEITKAKDTALHLAAFENQEEIVSKLIHIIRNFNNIDERTVVIGKQNERLNTPLHIAACLGHERICRDIASVDSSLVDIRNGDGETPLFLAALHGHKTSFLCLYSFCSSDEKRVANSRRNDGDSILHCAIRNVNFDLAFQIANLNEKIVNWKNGEGLTPLHLLASKPTAFLSGSNIGGWKKVIYHCTFVDELKPESTDSSEALINKNVQTNETSYPENYKTCIDFFKSLWEGILVVTTLKRVIMKRKKNQMKNDKAKKDEEANPSDVDEGDESSDIDLLERRNPKKEIFPENYDTCFNFVKYFCMAILIILGYGSIEIEKIRKKKEKHTWSNQVMEKILKVASSYNYGYDGSTPLNTKLEPGETRPYYFSEDGSVSLNNEIKGKIDDQSGKTKEGKKDDHQKHETLEDDKSGKTKPVKIETPVLMAAKNGVVEIVKKIHDQFPISIYDMNEEKKNVVLLAAEYRQPHVYNLLLEKKLKKKSVFREVDQNGNSVLHLAAKFGTQKPWRIPGAALQLQWDYKWYKYVKNSMPPYFFVRYNNDGKIPKIIFHESHKDLAKDGGQWLTDTAESCSVVAALIATVAFATAATVPGGNDQNSGTPVLLLLNHSAFTIFSFSSVIALCFSVTSVVMFLAILTSRFEDKEFRSRLPWKLLIGLSSLFFSIVAMLVSFCTGHFFLLNYQFQNAAVLLYTIVFLPVALISAIGQLPLYIDLLQGVIREVPSRSSEVLLYY